MASRHVIPPEAGRVPTVGTLRSLRALKREGPEFVLGLTTRHDGGVVRLKVGFGQLLLLTSPQLARHVFVDRADGYGLAPLRLQLRSVLGEGVATSEGAAWAQHRKLLTPHFLSKAIAALAPQIEAIVDGFLDELAARGNGAGFTVDLDTALRPLTLTVLMRTLFGPIDRRQVDHVCALCGEILRAGAAVFWTPPALRSRVLPHQRRLDAAIGELERFLAAWIGPGADRGSQVGLLAALCEAFPPDSETGRIPAPLRDQVITLFFAGHETTAIAAAWMVHLLGRRPDVAEAILHERSAAVEEAPPDPAATPPYTQAVVDETLRLYPPIWRVTRRALADDELDGVPVREGETVCVSPYALQRDPRHWEAPSEFRPERFVGAAREAIVPFAYLPFGKGPRACIGYHLAVLELGVFVQKLVERFTIETDPEAAHRLSGFFSLRMTPPLEVTLRHR